MLACAPAWAQHEDHAMHGDAAGDPKAWRMPPHDFPMPPLPGIADAVPIVGPFLAMMDAVDLSVFPEARPGEIVEMTDGETLVMRASVVRRTIRYGTIVVDAQGIVRGVNLHGKELDELVEQLVENKNTNNLAR